MEFDCSYLNVADLANLHAAVGRTVSIGPKGDVHSIVGELKDVYVSCGRLAFTIVGPGSSPNFHCGAVEDNTLVRVYCSEHDLFSCWYSH